MSSRASPYGISSRRASSKPVIVDADDVARKQSPTATTEEPTSAQRMHLQLQDVLTQSLSPAHMQVQDVSCRELQYRLLGAKRYWYRSIKQATTGMKRWEARYFETACRKSTLERLQATVTSWHRLPRLSSDDVQLTSLGQFDSERRAMEAFEAAFKARDSAHPLRSSPSATSRTGKTARSTDRTARTDRRTGRSSQSSQREMPSSVSEDDEPLAPYFQVVVVSDAFTRRTHRQRLELVYEILLDSFSNRLPDVPGHHHHHSSHRCIRGFSYVGHQVVSLPQWRSLPFHVTVLAKTPAQWKMLNGSKHIQNLSDTERFGMSHIENNRALNVDTTVLPMSRGLAELISSTNNNNNQPDATKLPHFYHGLPDELKKLISEEHSAAATDSISTTNKAFVSTKLSNNSEVTFLPKYLKRRREVVIAATRLQRLFRRNLQYKIIRFLTRRHRAATTIQRLFCGFRDRLYATGYRQVMICASTIVQAVFRSHASRERTKQLRTVMTHAALEIERVYRGHIGRTYVRWVRQMDTSAITIERVVRGFLARKRTARIRLAKHKRTVVIPAVALIQRTWRGHVGRQIATEKRQIHHKLTVFNPAAIKIERLLRGFLARRLATKYRRAFASASVIQKHWRSYRYYWKWMALMECRRRDTMASKIGALGRGYVARQFYKREKRRVKFQFVLTPSAVKIQKVFRGYRVRKRHEDLRDQVEAAITLQQMWRKRDRIMTIRSKLTGFRDAIHYAKATQIQYWYKCCRAKQLLSFLAAKCRASQGKAALAIQCAWKSHCSRVQLLEFRFCSRVERKALALTKWKEQREDIEFDIKDARADLKRVIKYKAKALRRVKELKQMRLDWECRQPVVEKELAELTQEDLDRGWREAFQTEKHILKFTLELSVEDIAGQKDQIRDYEAEIDDLRLEVEDLERDLEECILDETMELQAYREMEVQYAHKMFIDEQTRKIRFQKVHWSVRNIRKNVIFRSRDDLRDLQTKFMENRSVQELGALSFDKKQAFNQKVGNAIETIVQQKATQSKVMMEMGRDTKIVAGFDTAIEQMSKITNKFSYEYRLPKQDMRDMVDDDDGSSNSSSQPRQRMCHGCGRITCDCEEQLEAKRTAAAASTNSQQKQQPLALDFNNRLTQNKKNQAKATTTNYGHPLRRKRNYQQNEDE